MIRQGFSMDVGIPRNIRFVGPLLGAFRGFMGLFGFTEGPEKMELALEEAFSAVVREESSSEPLRVVFRRVPLGIRVVLRFSGEVSFGHHLPGEELPPEALEEDSSQTMGLFLMKHLVDRVSLSARGDEESEIHLFRRYVERELRERDRKIRREEHVPEAFPAERKEPEDEPEKREITVSFLGAAEASGITAFLSRMPLRGGSFLQYAYDSEDIGSLIHEKVLIPVGALDSSGNLMALGALGVQEEWGDRLFWLPPLIDRGAPEDGVFEEKISSLEESLLQRARETGREELFALIPRNDPQGIRRCGALGFRECGRVAAYFERLDPEGVLLFKPLREVASRKLYPPVQYRERLRSLAASLEMPAEFPERPLGDTPFSFRRSMMTLDVDHPRHRAFLTVLRYDADLLVQLHQHIQRLSSEGIRCILVRLSLESPDTALLEEGVEELGFRFSGMLPAASGGSELLLQWQSPS